MGKAWVWDFLWGRHGYGASYGEGMGVGFSIGNGLCAGAGKGAELCFPSPIFFVYGLGGNCSKTKLRGKLEGTATL